MTFKHTFFTATILLFGIFFNCSEDSPDDVSGNNITNTDSMSDENMSSAEKVTYNNTVKNIMSVYCMQCHGSVPANGASTSYVNYNQVSGNVNGIIARINNTSSPMPPSGLINLELRNQIQQWKDDGLLEN